MATVGVAAGLGLEDLSLVCLDAHDDLEIPSTNTNGYFDAMGMSMLKGESWHNLIATVPGFKPLSLDRLVYCGLRDISDESCQKVKDMKLDVVWGDSTKKVDFRQNSETCLELALLAVRMCISTSMSLMMHSAKSMTIHRLEIFSNRIS
ncbi:hypothetical protein D6D29_10752 [Aureobasidium pullulans]|nr:hypothetical protein D6D29_10752 [Aureobasidium pullulans]